MALLTFISNYLVNYTWQQRWIVFIIGEHLLIVGKFIISIYVDDIPEEVQIQLKRKDFIISKVINDEEDKIGSIYIPTNDFKSIYIANTDYDWIKPVKERDIDLNSYNNKNLGTLSDDVDEDVSDVSHPHIY